MITIALITVGFEISTAKLVKYHFLKNAAKHSAVILYFWLMHKVILLLFVFLSVSVFSFSQGSLNMELLDNWKQDSLITNQNSRVRYNDCFGFVWKGKEYAVAGSTEGTHVFEISSDDKFISRGFVKGRFSSVTVSHRDYATYKNFLYAVCDEGKSSLQVIDFSYLPDSVHLVKEDTLQFGRVHNIFIDSLTETFYSCIHRSTTSTTIIDSPLKVFSLADPVNLTPLWSGPDDIPEVHDIYVRDGKAFLNCGFDGLRIYNFKNNPANPAYDESLTFYNDQGYNHQGWLTPSGNTYVFADETNGKRVKKCSVNGNAIQINQLFGTNYLNESVPHNIMCTDTFAFVAYYNEGVRIFDLRKSPPQEIAYYDTYPEDHPFKLNGNWGIYSLLPSERILASDRQYGLFLLDFDRKLFASPAPEEEFNVYPNPVDSGEELVVRFPEGVTSAEWKLADSRGKIVSNGITDNASYVKPGTILAAGIYYLQIAYTNKLQEATKQTIKVLIL